MIFVPQIAAGTEFEPREKGLESNLLHISKPTRPASTRFAARSGTESDGASRGGDPSDGTEFIARRVHDSCAKVKPSYIAPGSPREHDPQRDPGPPLD